MNDTWQTGAFPNDTFNFFPRYILGFGSCVYFWTLWKFRWKKHYRCLTPRIFHFIFFFIFTISLRSFYSFSIYSSCRIYDCICIRRIENNSSWSSSSYNNLVFSYSKASYHWIFGKIEILSILTFWFEFLEENYIFPPFQCIWYD